MTRTDARELMMQVYYQMDMNNDYNIDSCDNYFKEKNLKGQKDYCMDLFSLLCNKKDEIDSSINTYSNSWKTTRMPKTDLAIARLAACEIMYFENLPAAISINEAVDLAKKYGTEQSPKYINAIMGKIAEQVK